MSPDHEPEPISLQADFEWEIEPLDIKVGTGPRSFRPTEDALRERTERSRVSVREHIERESTNHRRLFPSEISGHRSNIVERREQPQAQEEPSESAKEEAADAIETTIENALERAEKHYNETNPNKLSICVRCGTPVRNRGKQPFFDDNGKPWIRCPKGCEPPEGVSASCVPLDEPRRSNSVLEPTALDPGDAFYQKPDEPEDAESGKRESVPGHQTPWSVFKRRSRTTLLDDLRRGRR